MESKEMSLKEKCILLMKETGIDNLILVDKLESCNNESNKLHILQKLYSLLNDYSKIIKEIRNKPHILWDKEFNFMLKKLESANIIRRKINSYIKQL